MVRPRGARRHARAPARAGRCVKFLYTVPNFQNPTGLLVGLDKRRRLLEWAGRRDLLIVEDDPYRDLYFPDVSSEAETRAIATDDREGRVIYLSSFSKTLAPGFRVAWLSAAPALVARIELAKQASDLCTGALAQQMVNQACRRGILARQLPLLRDHYTKKRDVMVDALTETLGDALTLGPAAWRILPLGAASRTLDGDRCCRSRSPGASSMSRGARSS